MTERVHSNYPVVTESYDYRRLINEPSRYTEVRNIPMCNNNNDRMEDSVTISYKNTTQSIKLNNIYSRLTDICACVGITIEDAKRNKIFETIAGINSPEEINNLNEKEIEEIISTIDETFSFILNPKARAKSIIKKIPLIGNKIVGKISDEEILRLASEVKNRMSIKKQGISRREQAWFELTHKNLSAKIQKYLPENKELTDEDYKNAGIQLFKDMLGDIENLPTDKKEKKYDELKKMFYLYFTKLNSGNTEAAEQAMSAALSVLKAEDRVEAAGDLITSTASDKVVARRARAVQTSAEINLTTQDSFGNIVTENDATKYYATTFNYMDSQGIEDSLKEMDQRSGEILDEYNSLIQKQSSSGLSEEESKRLAQLELLKSRCVVSAYTGSTIGIQANRQITSTEANEYVSEIVQTAEKHRILDAVLTQTASYLNSKSFACSATQKENIIHTLNKHTNNRYNQLQDANRRNNPNQSEYSNHTNNEFVQSESKNTRNNSK